MPDILSFDLFGQNRQKKSRALSVKRKVTNEKVVFEFTPEHHIQNQFSELLKNKLLIIFYTSQEMLSHAGGQHFCFWSKFSQIIDIVYTTAFTTFGDKQLEHGAVISIIAQTTSHQH